LQVNTPPTSSITTIGSKVLCAGGYKTLYANSSDPAATFQWQLNGSNIVGATSQTYATYSSGTFNLIANNGCNVVSAPINITNLIFPSISANGPTTFCAGANVKLTSSVTDTSGIQYQWIKNGNNITSANSTIYYANDSGTYQVLIVVDSSCSAMSSPQTITVYPAPTPLIVANGGGIVLNTTQVYPHYQWYAGNTPTTLNPISGETNFSYTVAQTGYYAVSVNDFNNCSGMSSAIYVTMPTNGIQNMANVASMISLYPNPAHNTLYIKAPIKVNISLAGIDGRVLLQANEATEVDLSQLAGGMYMIRISDINGNMIKTEKIVKE
jgi:Secretion system C-terminal sorting domain